MKFIKVFLILASFSFALKGLSQSSDLQGTLKGTLKDSTGAPIPFATIAVDKLNLAATTDESGSFLLKNIPSGTHKIIVQAFGYQTKQFTVKIDDNAIVVKHFTLKEEVQSIDEVKVIGKKSESQQLKESGFNVNAIEMEQYKNSTADLNQIMNKSAGVRIRESGGMGSSYEFTINGLSGKQIRYFIDGVPMEIFGSAMTLNNVPSNLSERVEVYKGVVPVYLGADAMGGAVNVITNQNIKRYLDASYSIGSFNSHRAALAGQYTHERTGISVKANAFYNYSDNNYIMKDIDVWDEAAYSYIKKDLRRFHDRYNSWMTQVEGGISNKKWADVFYVGGIASSYDQQVQTGYKQEIIYGNITKKNAAYSGTMRFRKDGLLNNRLNTNIFASYTIDQIVIADTVKRRYFWDGASISSNYSEMGGSTSLQHFIRPKIYTRANLSYDLHANHKLNLNYTLDQTINNSYDGLLTNKDDIPGKLSKNILGLAYEATLFKKALVTQIFGKYYGIGLSKKIYNSAIYNYEKVSDYLANYGYGIAARLRILSGGIKGSVERAYRLQEVEEVFGDGLTTIGNPYLTPEYSDNFNLGLFYKINHGKHQYFIEAGGYYRFAKNFIARLPSERNNIMRNENIPGVNISGLEGEIKYSYSNLIVFSVNATHQKATNQSPGATYLNTIPNNPWFFGNADLGIGKNDVLGKNSRLQFNWWTQYVHWFYLTWESYGDKRGKSIIPTQVTQNASLSYSLQDGTYNISIECRNLTDALVYDNFRLQKPGRAFSVKLRYFISK